MSAKHSSGVGQDRTRLIGLLRSRADTIVERWTAEVTLEPYTRIADFTFTREGRAARLRSCFEALLRLAEGEDEASSRELLRMNIRCEHLRSIGLVKMVTDHHVLRRILRDAVGDALDKDDMAGAEALMEEMVDVCVEETVVIVEQYLEAQRVLTRCTWDATGASSDLNQTYASFCRSAMEYFDADMVALFEVNCESRDAVCIACFSKGIGLSRNARVAIGAVPLLDAAVSERRALSCVDVRECRGKPVRLVGRLSFEHCMAVPLVRDDKVTALMFVGDNARQDHYAPEEVGIAEELSKLVAKVLDSAVALRLLSIRSRAQRALIEAAADMQKEIESKEIYRILAEKLVELIPSDEVAFYVFDWSRNVGNPVYATGPYAAETMADRDFPADIGIVGAVARTRRAEIIADTEMDSRGEQIPDTPATHTAMLAVPILGRKEVLGVMELLRHLPAGYVEEELEIATMFASHAAVALENARLLNEALRVRDEIELHMDLLTHDIANYSTPLLGYLEALRDNSAIDHAVVDKATAQVENISRMIVMVRTLAKLRGNERGPLRRTDLKPAIERAVSDVRSYRAGSSLEFDLKLPDEPALVYADDLLPELFTNMFFTAIRSEKHDPLLLTVTVAPDGDGGDHWLVRVKYPERSIPDRLKHRVMQVAKTSKSELTGGFGMGLASARGIVERYSGRIWITDVDRGPPAKGFVLNIRLPKA